jgi:hypothetical protein
MVSKNLKKFKNPYHKKFFKKLHKKSLKINYGLKKLEKIQENLTTKNSLKNYIKKASK